jgi:hypothetical protein
VEIASKPRSTVGGAVVALFLACASLRAGPPAGASPGATAEFTFDQGVDGWVGIYTDPVAALPDGDGSSRCLVLKTESPVNREYVSPMFAVQSTHKYRISARIRVDTFGDGQSPLTINMLWFLKPAEIHNFGGWNVFRLVAEDEPRTFGWRRVQAVIEIPHRPWMKLPITHARIQVRNYRTVGTAYVDDIRVEPAAPDAVSGNRDSRTGI